MLSMESKRIMFKRWVLYFPPHLCFGWTVASLKVRVEMQAALAVPQYRENDAMINSWKNNHPLLHQNRRQTMTCRLQTVEESVLQKGSEFLANLERQAKIRHVIFGILPCVIITKLNQDANMAKKCRFRHDDDEAPSKKSKKESAKGSVASLKEEVQIGCVSQDSDPKKSTLRKLGELRLNASAGHTVKFSGSTWHRIKIREREGPCRGIIPKCEPHERNPCAPRFEDRSHEETSREKSWAREAAWNLAKTFISSKNKDKTIFYSPVEAKVPVFISTSKRWECLLLIQELLCTCWAKENWVQQKWIRWDGPGPPSRWWQQMGKSNNQGGISTRTWSRSIRDCAITGINASSFIAWRALLRTRIFIWVVKRSRATIDQKWNTNYLQNWPFRTSCCTGSVIRFRKQFVFNIEKAGNNVPRAIRNEDWSNSFGEPKQVRIQYMHSDSAVSGNRSEAHPDKTRSDVTGLGNRSGTESDKMERDDESQDVPEWLQKFTENLEDPEIPVPAHISREDSDSERPTKVVEKSKFRKRSFYIHFPKDRNCDVCLRTEITSSPCRRRTGEASLPRAEKFGDLITADHNVLHEESESRNNHRYAVSRNKILATQWIQFYPCEKNKLHQETARRACTEVFRTVTRKAKSHLHWQFIKNLANHVKN